ncbi:hypothetical protein DL89DRAFT_272781 [Linderina pennispora]|uniref:Uncharacterized protein n=1 Tax=Linderina pennispora TaxID=61395 RepID=A0A1Y1VRY5_9FUNG|nr:uncharacterized protein DL89DRAFT_272781 [Linderina pennispora]ORX64048.1 hypothetical protein DL89DRAFT_272781 [Linderina pennispora]
MGAHKKTVDKKLALKRKLQTTKRTAHVGKTTHDELKARRKQMKHLKAALAPSYASTKHSRPPRQDKDLSERLRGTAPIPTNAQLLNKAKEEREAMALAYENQQKALNTTVDELAQLMSK